MRDIAATILISTFDHSQLLPYSIDSILNQSIENLEIFVIGDGVGDDTRDIVNRYRERDSRIRFFDNIKGQRHGEDYRHQALQQARGRIVCYLSDDDYYFRDHVKAMIAALDEADFAHSCAVRVLPDQTVECWTVDLTLGAHRRELLGGRNRIPLSAGGHTLEAYKRLPIGWSPTPPGVPTDLYMWQKFLRFPHTRFRALATPTVLVFPSPLRRGWTMEQRASEMSQWAEALRTGTAASNLMHQVLALRTRESAERDAILLDLRERDSQLNRPAASSTDDRHDLETGKPTGQVDPAVLNDILFTLSGAHPEHNAH